MAEAGIEHQTIIGADTHIKGEMSFDGIARLLGTFEGKINAKGDLHIAESATCRATVDANKVTIDGTLEGNITARERTELTSKAKVKGDLITARLSVADGATYSGHCTVGPDASNVRPRAAETSGTTVTETKPAWQTYNRPTAGQEVAARR